jgi:hypothetical protein
MHCELYIPDFFPPEGLPRADSLAAAETLIARGRRTRRALVSPEAWLFGRFGVARQRDWPVAPYTLLADGGAPGPHYWMRADPVHLQVGRDSLGLVDSAAFDVSRAESEALVEALNRHFGQTMLFHSLRPARWYVRIEKAPDMQTTPAAAARGAAIDEKLPSGPDGMRFRALMNEAQMLLHEHPVNAEREARGEPALNSIWFWGGGVIDTAKARPFLAVIADDPLARGLALAAGIPAPALPRGADSVLAALGDEGRVLVVAEASREAQLRGRRATLERDWFVPLLGALKSGRIGMLTLHLCGADSLLEVETVRSDLRHFWRRRKPLSAYV